jgi:hypothetical protein
MDESKRKMIEARLQELLAESDTEKPKVAKNLFNSRRTVTVIRRRKGRPDFQPA